MTQAGSPAGSPAPTRPKRAPGKRTQPALPPEYRVIVLNDDVTPFDFVIMALVRIFQLTAADAAQLAMHIHTHGAGTAGVYPFQIAEAKAAQLQAFARSREVPLACRLEPATPAGTSHPAS